MKTLRLGYVGCGFVAQKVHLPSFTALEGCEVTAVAEVRDDLREAVADRFGIERRYRNHKEMAEAGGLDAVAVSAAFTLQGEIAAEFLRRGLPVFMEKPMATTRKQAERILAAARKGGGRLMVGYMKRYDAGNQLARDTVRALRGSGELGRIIYVRNHGFCGDWSVGNDAPVLESALPYPDSPRTVPDWVPEDRRDAYLGYLQQYTHNLNLVRWLLDADDRATVRFVDLDERDGRTGITVLEVDGVRTVIESGHLSHHAWDEHTQIFFEHGWVRTASPPLLLKHVPAEVEVYRTRPTHTVSHPRPDPPYSWSYQREAAAFIDGVRTGEPFDASGEDTLTDVRLYEEIYRDWLTRRGEI